MDLDDPFTYDPIRACAGIPVSEFFPEHGDRYGAAAAKRVCRVCPIVGMCREYATATNQVGIWGGTTDEERQKERARRQRVVRAQAGGRRAKQAPAARRMAVALHLVGKGVPAGEVARHVGVTPRSVERYISEARRAA